MAVVASPEIPHWEVRMMSVTHFDPYKVLGVHPSVSDEDIRSAYRRAMKRVHPDTGSGDPAKAREVNEAYELLSDPQARAAHDAEAAAAAAPPRPEPSQEPRSSGWAGPAQGAYSPPTGAGRGAPAEGNAYPSEWGGPVPPGYPSPAARAAAQSTERLVRTGLSAAKIVGIIVLTLAWWLVGTVLGVIGVIVVSNVAGGGQAPGIVSLFDLLFSIIGIVWFLAPFLVLYFRHRRRRG